MKRFGVEVKRTGWRYFDVPAGTLRFARENLRRGRRLLGFLLPRRGRDRRRAGARRGRRARTASRATCASPRCWSAWAPSVDLDRTGSRRPADGQLQGDRPRPEPHSRRRDDRGGARAVRRRAERDPQHRQLAGEGDRPPRGDGHRAAQARRAGGGGRGLPEDHAAGELNAGAAIDTYDDHRMAMCFSLVALGGVPVRINDPDCVAKTFPDYFDVFQTSRHDCETWRPGCAEMNAPVIAIDGPSASGKGTIAKQGGRGAGLPLPRERGAVPADRAVALRRGPRGRGGDRARRRAHGRGLPGR